MLLDAVCLFVAFPSVHHHEHLVFAFFYFSVCLIILLLPIKKKDSVEGTQVIESGPPSNWVSQLKEVVSLPNGDNGSSFVYPLSVSPS